MKGNWKFWTWAKQVRELRTLEEFHDQVTQVSEANAALRREATQQSEANAALRREVAELEKLYQRTPEIITEAQQNRANLERLLVLAGMRQDEPLWLVLLSYADEHARNEAQMAFLPNLDDAARHYNAGRAAGAADFASALRELRLQAEREARKQTKE